MVNYGTKYKKINGLSQLIRLQRSAEFAIMATCLDDTLKGQAPHPDTCKGLRAAQG